MYHQNKTKQDKGNTWEMVEVFYSTLLPICLLDLSESINLFTKHLCVLTIYSLNPGFNAVCRSSKICDNLMQANQQNTCWMLTPLLPCKFRAREYEYETHAPTPLHHFLTLLQTSCARVWTTQTPKPPRSRPHHMHQKYINNKNTLIFMIHACRMR